jgi:hypothetical protein
MDRVSHSGDCGVSILTQMAGPLGHAVSPTAAATRLSTLLGDVALDLPVNGIQYLFSPAGESVRSSTVLSFGVFDPAGEKSKGRGARKEKTRRRATERLILDMDLTRSVDPTKAGGAEARARESVDQHWGAIETPVLFLDKWGAELYADLRRGLPTVRSGIVLELGTRGVARSERRWWDALVEGLEKRCTDPDSVLLVEALHGSGLGPTRHHRQLRVASGRARRSRSLQVCPLP